MDLLKELNQYFIMNSKSIQDFKKEFKEEFVPHAHGENLLNFLLHIDRKIKGEDEVIEMIMGGEKRRVLRGTMAWKSYLEQGFVEKN